VLIERVERANHLMDEAHLLGGEFAKPKPDFRSLFPRR
jgi:hypothetical protein